METKRTARRTAVLALAALALAAPAASADPGHGAQAVPLAWTPGAAHPFMRSEALGAAVDGKLYVVGGYDTEHDPDTDDPTSVTRLDVFDGSRWTSGAPAPQALTHTPAVVDGRDLWLIGGFEGDSPGGSVANTWRYETDNDRWLPGPPLPEPRGAGGAAIVGRTIHYFGGANRPADSERLTDRRDHWALDLSKPSPAWERRRDMPNPRNHLAGVGLGGLVYAIGGQEGADQQNGNVGDVDRYDPASDTWTSMAELQPARGHINAAVFTANGTIWVVGGTQSNPDIRGGEPSTAVSVFDPLAGGQWQPQPALPEGRKNPVVGHLGDRIAVSTGYGTPVKVAGIDKPTGFRDTTWTGAHQRTDEPVLPPPGYERRGGLPSAPSASSPAPHTPPPSSPARGGSVRAGLALGVSVRSVSSSRGWLRVRVACSGTVRARGRLVARTSVRGGRATTLVRRALACAPDTSVTVRARLSTAGRRALRRAGARVRVSLALTDGRGSEASTETLVRVRRR
jgi:N-acetylneuraminic acid mutarotase